MSDTAFNVCLKPLINDSTGAQFTVCYALHDKSIFILQGSCSFRRHVSRPLHSNNTRTTSLGTDLFSDCQLSWPPVFERHMSFKFVPSFVSTIVNRGMCCIACFLSLGFCLIGSRIARTCNVVRKRTRYATNRVDCLQLPLITFFLLLMVSSSLYVSHMFVTRVLSSLVFRVVLLQQQ